MPSKFANDPSPATAVDRALSILEAVAGHREGLTNSDISRRLEIPKSSASYILRALERRGYLRRDVQNARYRLGLKILSLGRDARENLDIAEVALPFMQAMVERLQLTSHLAVLDQGEPVYIEKVDGPGFFKVNTSVGRRALVHSTSVGKVLLAWRPKTEVETLLRGRELKKRTPNTITSISRFVAELERVRVQGYAVDDEENSPGARCVGVPVFDAMGGVTAALNVSGTITQIEDGVVPRIAETLKENARRISRQLLRTGAAV